MSAVSTLAIVISSGLAIFWWRKSVEYRRQAEVRRVELELASTTIESLMEERATLLAEVEGKRGRAQAWADVMRGRLN